MKGCERSEGRDVLVLVVGRGRHDAMTKKKKKVGGGEGRENTRGKQVVFTRKKENKIEER
jgi:hypothetical protein